MSNRSRYLLFAYVALLLITLDELIADRFYFHFFHDLILITIETTYCWIYAIHFKLHKRLCSS